MTLRIEPIASPYGICKIVPPDGWDPPCQVDLTYPNKFPTRLQRISTLQQGEGFDDGNSYTLAQYKVMADRYKQQWADTHHEGVAMSKEEIKDEYWRIVETASKEAVVEYGNDLDTSQYKSGFIKTTAQSLASLDVKPEPFSEDFYATTGWNLNCVSKVPGSLLRRITTPINGVNVPWLYFGMIFSTFCWHIEDNYLYSINYSHFGEGKQWYGVPPSHAKAFEKVLLQLQ